MPETVLTTCPACGGNLPFQKRQKRCVCEACEIEYAVKSSEGKYFLLPVEQVLEELSLYANKKSAEIAIKKLKGEIRNLEVELKELTATGSPLETVRAVGLSVIALGLIFAILYNGITNTSVLAIGAVGIVTGIVLHSSTEFIGKDYYIRKAYLKELIHKKRSEILKHEQSL